MLQFQIDDEIKVYFEGFGEVESVETNVENDLYFGFVQFKLEEAAGLALLNGTHRIANGDVIVKAADPWHQPHHILNKLDGDCLRTILQYLDSSDLANVAEVCVLFNQLAKQAFTLKNMKLDQSNNNPLLESKEFHRMMSHFGSSIQSLKIHSKVVPENVFERYTSIIAEFCTNLKEIHLESFHTGLVFCAQLRRIYANLDKLHLVQCSPPSDGDVADISAACLGLEVLTLNDCKLWSTESDWMQQKFRRLKEAHFYSNEQLDDEKLNTFIALNPTLTKLSVVENGIKSAKMIRLIYEGLPDLQELHFDQITDNSAEFQRNLKILSRFSSLKVLKLNFNSSPVAPLMKAIVANGIPIEELKLRNGRIDDEAINNISKMKLITLLFIAEIEELADEHLITLAKGLPQIQFLCLEKLSAKISTDGLKKMLPYANQLVGVMLDSISNIKFDMDDSNSVLNIVKNRPERKQFFLVIKSFLSILQVPQTIILENKDYFYVMEHELAWVQSSNDHGDEVEYDSDYAMYDDNWDVDWDDVWDDWNGSDADADMIEDD